MCLYRLHSRFCVQNWLYRLRACRGARMNTLSIICKLLYSLGQGTDYAGHPDESLARQSVYSRPVTGCKSGVKARVYTQFKRHPTSPIPFVVVSCLSYTLLNFVSGSLLTYFWHFHESSPVQSSPLQSSPVQSTSVQSGDCRQPTTLPKYIRPSSQFTKVHPPVVVMCSGAWHEQQHATLLHAYTCRTLVYATGIFRESSWTYTRIIH